MWHMYYICGMNNPFVYGGDGIVLEEVTTWHHSRSFDDGGIKAKWVTMARKVVDRERYIKVFCDWVKVLRGLSYNGIKVLFHVMDILEKDKDYVVMDMFLYCRISGDCKNVYYRGVKDLVRCGIIMKRGSGGSYWINPHVMYNGNRKLLVG